VTIEELKAIQAQSGLEDFHLVHTDEDRWTIAHTDAERASGMDLAECYVHQYMSSLSHNPFPGRDIVVLDDAWSTHGPRVDLEVVR
jgi:hypothetical protein